MTNACMLTLALLAAWQEPQPIPMKILSEDATVGSATYLQKLLPDGGKVIAITLTLRAADGKGAQVRTESVYDSFGGPVRKIQETLTLDGKRIENRIATFDETGAELVTEKDGQRTVKAVELVKGAPRNAKSEFWFVRDKPEKGEKCAYYQFDLAEGRWKLVESVYEGPTEIEVGGKTLTAQKITTAPSVAYLDEKGWPIVLVVGTFKLERTQPEQPWLY